jgi:hypothetical protein
MKWSRTGLATCQLLLFQVGGGSVLIIDTDQGIGG